MSLSLLLSIPPSQLSLPSSSIEVPHDQSANELNPVDRHETSINRFPATFLPENSLVPIVRMSQDEPARPVPKRVVDYS